MDNKNSRHKNTRKVSGYWGKCEVCQQHLPLHPELKLCGCCTFGSADDIMAFEGTWEEEIPNDH